MASKSAEPVGKRSIAKSEARDERNGRQCRDCRPAKFKIFTIPAIPESDDGSATDEMNRFLRSHKVLEVEQQLISTKSGTHWHFCIKYLANAQPDKSGTKSEIKSQNSSKVDYKDILDEKTFAVFSILREIRKKIAEEEGMPVYAIFTNEELAGIAALDEILPETIKTVLLLRRSQISVEKACSPPFIVP